MAQPAIQNADGFISWRANHCNRLNNNIPKSFEDLFLSVSFQRNANNNVLHMFPEVVHKIATLNKCKNWDFELITKSKWIVWAIWLNDWKNSYSILLLKWVNENIYKTHDVIPFLDLDFFYFTYKPELAPYLYYKYLMSPCFLFLTDSSTTIIYEEFPGGRLKTWKTSNICKLPSCRVCFAFELKC